MYKLTKSGKSADGEDFWYMEWIDNDKIQENIENSDDVCYLDVPSKEEGNRIMQETFKKAAQNLIQKDTKDVIYLDIPSDEDRKKKWEDKLNKILPFLIKPNKTK